MKNYEKPLISEEEIDIEDICIISNDSKGVIDDEEGYSM